MELYQAKKLSDHSQRQKSWLWTESDRREKVLQEDRTRCLQEIEELKKLWPLCRITVPQVRVVEEESCAPDFASVSLSELFLDRILECVTQWATNS